MSEDCIKYNAAGDAVAFCGPDAVRCYQCASLIAGIGLLQKGIKPNSNWTMKAALAMASRFTGKTYRRKDADAAKADLTFWLRTMKSALPHETIGE